jgi:ribonuclease T2
VRRRQISGWILNVFEMWTSLMSKKTFGVMVLACFAGLLSSSVQSQAWQCVPPTNLPRPKPELAGPNEARRVPVAGYLLTLSWSPEYCRDHKATLQCSGKMGDFGFVLHGLWPEGAGKDYPMWCKNAALVAPKIIARNMCMTPSVQLLQHEWAKHGTCMAQRPEAYFGAAKLLYDAVIMPDMAKLSRTPINARGVADGFADINPGLPASAIAVHTDDKGWLDEVRICLGKDLKPQACGPGKKGAPDKALVKVWRGG